MDYLQQQDNNNNSSSNDNNNSNDGNNNNSNNLSPLSSPHAGRGGGGRGGLRFLSRDRPYPCHVCGKRFTQKAHLIIHKRTHTGEKPYACHICHKRFAQSSHLTVHKRVHTGEKPFFCNFCGMGFCRRPRLEAHILQHVVKEGREMPSGLKGDPTLNGLSMVGLDGSGAGVVVGVGVGAGVGPGDHPAAPPPVNQESLDAAAQLMELKMKGGVVVPAFLSQVKYEPPEDQGEYNNSSFAKARGIDEVGGGNDNDRQQRLGTSPKGDFSRISVGMDGGVIDVDEVKENSAGHRGESSNGNDNASHVNVDAIGSGPGSGGSGAGAGSLLGLSAVDEPSSAPALTELTEQQKQALSQSLLLSTHPHPHPHSQKGQPLTPAAAAMLSPPHHHHHHHHPLHQQQQQQMVLGGAVSGGLTMTGLVRTNSRVSLIDFTAEDILQHMLSRDDVKSCDFCCVVFRDPAMYYLHRSMHDKMDVRCCNLCGKLLKDKYDFTAHFLNQHT